MEIIHSEPRYVPKITLQRHCNTACSFSDCLWDRITKNHQNGTANKAQNQSVNTQICFFFLFCKDTSIQPLKIFLRAKFIEGFCKIKTKLFSKAFNQKKQAEINRNGREKSCVQLCSIDLLKKLFKFIYHIIGSAILLEILIKKKKVRIFHCEWVIWLVIICFAGCDLTKHGCSKSVFYLWIIYTLAQTVHNCEIFSSIICSSGKTPSHSALYIIWRSLYNHKAIIQKKNTGKFRLACM